MSIAGTDILSQLLFRYVDAVNTGDSTAFVGTFAPDGEWESPGLFHVAGHVKIRATIEAAMARYDWLYQVSHNSRVVAESPTRIQGRTYVTEMGCREGSGHFMLAVYDDICVIADGEWRFAKRQCNLLYRGASALTDPPCAYPAPAVPRI